MDKLQEKINKQYEEATDDERETYLKEGLKFHRQASHFHMFMERKLATQLQELTGESQENTADLVTSQDGTQTADNE